MARQKSTAAEKREEAEAKRRERAGESQVAAEQALSAEIDKTNAAHFQNPGAVADAHGEIAQPKSSGGKVIVALKLGVAYFDIQLSRLKDVQENTQTGPRTVKQAERYGPVVRLRGTAYPRGTPPVGFPEKPTIIGGAALNPNVDADFWEAWVEQHRLDPLVVNGLIFAHKDISHVQGRAAEEKANLSGLEPVNPLGDPRSPRSTRADVTNIETEESKVGNMKMLGQLQG